jgi:hypothetical protein
MSLKGSVLTIMTAVLICGGISLRTSFQSFFAVPGLQDAGNQALNSLNVVERRHYSW